MKAKETKRARRAQAWQSALRCSIKKISFVVDQGHRYRKTVAYIMHELRWRMVGIVWKKMRGIRFYRGS
jgi:hypothetical protein